MLPINCPYCNEILINSFADSLYENEHINKLCLSRIGHRFSIYSVDGIDPSLTLFSNNQYSVSWTHTYRSLSVNANVLPWYSPTFNLGIFYKEIERVVKLVSIS